MVWVEKRSPLQRGANGLPRVGTLTLAPAATQNRRSPAVVPIANLAGWRGRQLAASDAGARSATWRGPLTRSPAPVPCGRCPGHHDRLAVPLAPPQPQPQPRWPVSGPSAGRPEPQVRYPSRHCCRNAFWGMSRHRSLRRADADDPLEHELCTGRASETGGTPSRVAAARNPSPQDRRDSARAGRTRREKKPGPKDPGRNNQIQGQRIGQSSLKTGNSPLGDGINIADNDHDNSTGK